jgi:two-component system cell cycle sensor histidine kinase/response regulator CckA
MEAIGQLAGGVAHDFNNLLTVILGAAELLRRNPAVPSSAQAPLRRIEAKAKRGAELTRQLLAFGRKQPRLPVRVNATACVRQLLPILSRTLGEQVEVHLELDPGVAPVWVDRGQLEQVLLNLALNARDAMPGGGELTFRTRRVRPDDPTLPLDVPREDYVAIEVEDTGTGIAPEIQARIFDPFFTTKPVGQGTGLGLAAVYGIVRQSGGYVRVQSRPGRGSTFRIFLPPLEREEARADLH